MARSIKSEVLQAAKALFMTHGYHAIGIRDIADAVGKKPVQLYRLSLSKSNILAELIVELNDEEIKLIPEMTAHLKAAPLLDKVSGYLLQLYQLDIAHIQLRSVSAVFGWMWDEKYESTILDQLMQLSRPVFNWMADEKLKNIHARCYGIWSIYLVGFRKAVLSGASAEQCIEEILPTLRILLCNSKTAPTSLFVHEKVSA